MRTPLTRLSAQDIRSAFPLGELRADDLTAVRSSAEGSSAGGSNDASEPPGSQAPAGTATDPALFAGLTGVDLQTLIVAILEAGEAARASAIVKNVIRSLPGDSSSRYPAQRLVTQRNLLIAAVVLLLAYVLWFAWKRMHAVAASDGRVETSYRRVAARLLPAAVCIGLLLVSAIGIADTNRTAAVTLAAASVLKLDGQDRQVSERFARAIERQRRYIATLRPSASGNSGANVWGSIADIQNTMVAGETAANADRARVKALQEKLAALQQALSVLSKQIETQESVNRSLAQHLGDMKTQLDGVLPDIDTRLDRALSDVGKRLGRALSLLAEMEQRQPKTGVALVIARNQGSFRISGSGLGQHKRRGTWVGAHKLAPGPYTVTSQGQSKQITIEACNLSAHIIGRSHVGGVTLMVKPPQASSNVKLPPAQHAPQHPVE